MRGEEEDLPFQSPFNAAAGGKKYKISRNVGELFVGDVESGKALLEDLEDLGILWNNWVANGRGDPLRPLLSLRSRFD